MSFEKIAIANRGEIAKRIITTCHELNLKTVLLYASGDTHQEAYRLAGERVCIGPAEPLKSYLNIPAQIEGARSAGAKFLHPGYGFLSENPEFAKACEENHISFIGPSSKTISLFGNKIKAREMALKAGVPTLSSEPLPLKIDKNAKQDRETSKQNSETSNQASENSLSLDANLKKKLREKVRGLGYPLMIKSASGGGGRGLRIAHSEEELEQLLPLVYQESIQSFNSREIFLEKYLDQAKHIEVQVFVSASGEIFILGDRDCSAQRRHQKILEEAPSSLPQPLKEKMKSACYELCSLMDYQGAGTLEFLAQGDQFYFLEMNTRLQVEHTVTEMIYGIDLVKAQILTALGRPPFLTSQLKERGHSLQCRICAEDPSQNFLPSVGKLLSCVWPSGQNIRVDTGFQTGDEISSFYDSLIAKVIVWEENRTRTIEKMNQALSQTLIFGVSSNIAFLKFLILHKDFISNQLLIPSLEKIHATEYSSPKLPLPETFLRELYQEMSSGSQKEQKQKPFNPWYDFPKS